MRRFRAHPLFRWLQVQGEHREQQVLAPVQRVQTRNQRPQRPV